jgi:hypothetical protein
MLAGLQIHRKFKEICSFRKSFCGVCAESKNNGRESPRTRQAVYIDNENEV